MAQPTDLAERILIESSGLFRENGYDATSIKQIADASGCTTAALYYYFEGGKSEILREVILRYQEGTNILQGIETSESLADFVANLTANLAGSLPMMADQIGWALLQFPNLDREDQRVLQDGILTIHTSLSDSVQPFVDDSESANRVAWLLYCAFFGYHQLFYRAKIETYDSLDLLAFGEVLSELFEKNATQ